MKLFIIMHILKSADDEARPSRHRGPISFGQKIAVVKKLVALPEFQ
jgi:hypothetical protein